VIVMGKIVTLGEIMLRLSTPGQLRFTQAHQFDIHYGGGEANVAVSLAQFGHDAHFVTKLPKNEMGDAALHALKSFSVNTNFIARGGNRLGIYFLETGASMRPSKVIYDRTNSSIAEADLADFNLDEIFKDCTWFHWSGITPAISKKAQVLIKAACQKAKEVGATISVDLNYRKKLWTPKEAQEVMIPLMSYVDVCIGNEEDAELVLGFKPKHVDISKGELSLDSYQTIFKEMKEVFGFKVIATTLRESFSATKNGWSALLMHQDQFYVSKHYIIDPIIDRVGGGDSFSAGLIHGLLKMKPQDAIEFAVAASALKHTISGDFNVVSETEVIELMNGDQSGRVQR